MELILNYVCICKNGCASICGHIIEGYRFPFEQRSQARSRRGSTIIREGMGRLVAAYVLFFILFFAVAATVERANARPPPRFVLLLVPTLVRVESNNHPPAPRHVSIGGPLRV